MDQLTPELLLNAYGNGYFPMADDRNAKDLHWFYPKQRGIIPLDKFHVPKSLTKFLKAAPFIYSTNHAFRDVITACAERDSTWINDKIIDLYCKLHAMGFAHSVEVWENVIYCEDNKMQSADCTALSNSLCEGHQTRNGGDKQLIGGLYGVSLGGAFFGESMFSQTTNASKAALVHLVQLLNEAGYSLLDTQYVNDHLKQFGVIEIPREEYLKQLENALIVQPNGNVWG